MAWNRRARLERVPAELVVGGIVVLAVVLMIIIGVTSCGSDGGGGDAAAAGTTSAAQTETASAPPPEETCAVVNSVGPAAALFSGMEADVACDQFRVKAPPVYGADGEWRVVDEVTSSTLAHRRVVCRLFAPNLAHAKILDEPGAGQGQEVCRWMVRAGWIRR